MNVTVVVGDVLDQAADVLVCPANPWLNMSGGVGGAVLARGGDSIESELQSYLASLGKPVVSAGTVILTSSGSLPFKQILHAVAIGPSYDSSIELVRETLESCFERAASLEARSIAVPAVATSYGQLSISSFAKAVASLFLRDWPPLEDVQLVMFNEENARIVRNCLERQCEHYHEVC
jgi:O-acetyl-ADP-ribose deacetylase (regulator of RNase III)